MTRCRGIIRRADEYDFHAANLQEGLNIFSAGDGFDDWDNEHVLIGFLSALDETLSPGCGAVGADAANALRWIRRERDGLPELLRCFDPRYDNAVRADV